MKRRFVQCDVFSATPYYGNPLAVVIDGAGLSDLQMQNFSSWTNLSETTFLMPPEDPLADYKVRIFTPTFEMPFAGHPTLGSCAAWLDAGNTPKSNIAVVQECNIGLVSIDINCDPPAFVAPPTSIDSMSSSLEQGLISALGVQQTAFEQSIILDNGPVWNVLELSSAADVLSIDVANLNWNAIQSAGLGFSGCLGLIGAHTDGCATVESPDYEVRLFAPEAGIVEDPITGSLNAALALWLDAQGRLGDTMVVSQGAALDRQGRVFVRRDSSSILIGGHSHILINGYVDL